jgi:glycosyltransferase involved in cell wall biosynthesis
MVITPHCKKRVALLSMGAIEDDPRIRRVGNALVRAGMEVRAFGLGHGRAPSPDWPIFAADPPILKRISARRARRVCKTAAVRMLPGLAEQVYWQEPRSQALMMIAQDWPAHVYIANDWPTLPIAAALAERHRGLFLYDSHELATDELPHVLKWRLLRRPYVAAIEDLFIRRAARVVTVSPGIAGVLKENYRLPERPLVLRNAAEFEDVPDHPVDPSALIVLYHGLLVPKRGLEETIASVVHWRPEFRLVIRGPGSAAYRMRLTTLAERLNVRERVSIQPPVAMTDLIRTAAAADIGLLALPASSRHNLHALPNKIFEYIMAGLALCISDLPDMAQVVREHALGRLIEAVTPEGIARAVNSFDAAEIRACRARSRTAALALNWDAECRTLVDAISTLSGVATARR